MPHEIAGNAIDRQPSPAATSIERRCADASRSASPLLSAVPDRADRVDHVPRREPSAGRRLRVARRAAAQSGALPRDLGPPGAVDGAARAAAGEQLRVGGQHDGVDLLRRQVADRELDHRSASSPNVSPGGKPAHAVEREQNAGHERLAGGRVVADRERLARAAQDDLLVRDEPRQAHRVDRDVRRPCAAAVALAVPDGASIFVSACSSMISAWSNERAASAANRIIRTAPSAKFGATKHAHPRSRASRSSSPRSSSPRPVVPITQGHRRRAPRRRCRGRRPAR